jgi:LacI family transcriptional regulator
VTKPHNTTIPRRVTLKDLSERLGLSRTTISLVLNNAPLASTIARATRERVLKAAREYRYKPDYFARYLNERRSYLVGVLSPDLAQGYDAEIFTGIEEHLLQSPYHYFVTSHEWVQERIQRTAQLFLERGVEGVILINTNLEAEIDVPVISIGERRSAGGGTTILIDNAEGIRSALAYLVSLGHRKIAFMRGHKDSADTDGRWRAMVETANSLSLKIDSKLVVQLERLGMQQTSALEEGARCADRLLSRSQDFTALLAFNDMSAIGAMHRFRDAGRRIPEDLSIVGFDDTIAARLSYPQLTTVRQPLRQMGERAAREVIKAVTEGAQDRRIVMTPDLVVRGSTAEARTAR